MSWAILDTNVYIGHWEQGLYEEVLASVQKAFVVRHSAVVLSELRRGARTRRAQKLVDGLFRLASTQWEPFCWYDSRIARGSCRDDDVPRDGHAVLGGKGATRG